ncbi:MAG: YraN family protein [Gammaproteobacteria bacterium]
MPSAESKAPHLLRGAQAEDRALAYLAERGFRLLQRNYRCPAGEIDLIMEDGAVLAFIEVRFRKSSRYGNAAESVTPVKQSRIIKTANHYLAAHRPDRPVRFDVVTVSPAPDGQFRLDLIKNAFQC